MEEKNLKEKLSEHWSKHKVKYLFVVSLSAAAAAGQRRTQLLTKPNREGDPHDPEATPQRRPERRAECHWRNGEGQRPQYARHD